jgi:flagellar basal-body rod protein FlgB
MAGGEDPFAGPSFGEAAITPIAHEIHGLMERPDGNNVSVERESLLLAQNQLHFTTAVAFLKAEFHRLTLAINGGSTS